MTTKSSHGRAEVQKHKRQITSCVHMNTMYNKTDMRGRTCMDEWDCDSTGSVLCRATTPRNPNSQSSFICTVRIGGRKRCIVCHSETSRSLRIRRVIHTREAFPSGSETASGQKNLQSFWSQWSYGFPSMKSCSICSRVPGLPLSSPERTYVIGPCKSSLMISLVTA